MRGFCPIDVWCLEGQGLTHSELQISGHTGLYAVIGDPVEHSLSPLIMNSAFFAANGIDAVYVALTVGIGRPAGHANGAVVRNSGRECDRMPLKQAIVPWLGWLSPEASLVGAANCVRNRGGVLEGHNTDCAGFRLSLKSSFPKGREPFSCLARAGRRVR